MNGMAKVGIDERFLHMLVVGCLMNIGSTYRHLISARLAFSEFL
jgi:hypothetical protein